MKYCEQVQLMYDCMVEAMRHGHTAATLEEISRKCDELETILNPV